MDCSTLPTIHENHHFEDLTILLVDDHHIFREGLAMLLTSIGLARSVVHAASLAEAQEAIAKHSNLDLVLLDLSLPNLGRLHAVEQLRAYAPSLTIVVMSADESFEAIERSIALGAAGYITKSARLEEMRTALEHVQAGRVAVPSSTFSTLPTLLQDERKNGENVKGSGLAEPLTQRQLEILSLLVRGQPNKVMARTLGISENTVKTHLATIYGILQVTSRTQAVLMTARLQLKLPAITPSAAVRNS